MIDPEVIARVAERKIQEAIEEGKFDNLPGKGKPIVFEEDAGVSRCTSAWRTRC